MIIRLVLSCKSIINSYGNRITTYLKNAGFLPVLYRYPRFKNPPSRRQKEKSIRKQCIESTTNDKKKCG